MRRWIGCFFVFIAGIVTGGIFHISGYVTAVIVAVGIAVFILMLYVYRKPGSMTFGVLAFFMLYLVGWLWVEPYTLSPDKFLGRDSNLFMRVSSIPRRGALSNNFYASVYRLDGHPVSFKVKVKDFGRRRISLRDRIFVRGVVRRSRFASRIFTLSLRKNTVVEKLPVSFFDRYMQKLTDYLLVYFRKNLSGDAYPFIAAVILGRREMVDYATKSAFVHAGVAHLMAISGLHVGILGILVFHLLQLIRLKYRLRLVISVAALFFYSALTGTAPSTLRAVCMYTIFACGFLLRRRIDTFDMLGLAGVVCLIINPLWVYDVGFVLSFLSVGGIILGFRMFPLKKVKPIWLSEVKKAVLSTVFATVSIAAVVAYYFGRIYPVSIFSNIILIPFFTVVVLTAAIMMVGAPIPLWGYLIGPAVSLMVSVFTTLTSYLGSCEWLQFSWSVSFTGLLGYYTVLLFAVGIFNLLKYKALATSY